MELKKKENIGWIDLLRVLACFCYDDRGIAITRTNRHGSVL